MQVRLLLGPAGSGKTFGCLTEVRAALAGSPEGPPLLLVAPKQTTYQLERQLLADPSIPGYTRLHILSFERLAHFIFDRLHKAPEMLNEEGRLMVLRGLLAKKRDELKLFRASARLTGFAQELSLVLRELQRNQLTPESLNELAQQVQGVEGLAYKLQDLALLLRGYLDWLKAHKLQDADCLLQSAAQALREAGREPSTRDPRASTLFLEHLWVDGFAEWSLQELDLLGALMPHCQEATLTFCLDRVPTEKISWLSTWSVVRKTFEDCKKSLESLPNATVTVELLRRDPNKTRFQNNPVLAHLEESWADPQPYPPPAARELSEVVQGSRFKVQGSKFPQVSVAPIDSPTPLRLATCIDPEAEATLAAREILRHVRAGGRYRDVAVLVRKLEGYHEPLQRIFSRYEIPFFLDRRESVAHHPLAELTRSALRTVAFQWLGADWFAALKTGLVPAEDKEIDELENEALARGWKGRAWHEPLRIKDQPKSEADSERLRQLETRLQKLQQRLLPPFERLALVMATQHNQPTGPHLAAALREFWKTLEVEQRLQQWASTEFSDSELQMPNSVHATVWEQMNAWLENVELAFPNEALPLREWLPILEAGLANLSVGVIPPALDQVLIGAVDRSRNPDVKLAFVLGMNETVFPAPPETTVLLTDADRVEIEKRGILLSANARQQLGRERFYAYIACTRARERLVLTSALHDANGSPLNPSPFLTQVRQIFPDLETEVAPKALDWRESQHVNELIVPLLKVQSPELEQHQSGPPCGRSRVQSQTMEWEKLLEVPALSSLIEQLRHFRSPRLEDSLSPELATRLYGPVLHTSVSRMEQFAACPFKFFVHSGLQAKERDLFELDFKEQGSFQHDALALFHEQLRRQNQRWRDITPPEARDLVAKIARSLMMSYRDGLFQSTEQGRFMARVLTESLRDFVETLVGWMRLQYQFDPVAVELPFGEDESSPAWKIPLDNGHRLELYGRIDRVDICRPSDSDKAVCVVVDYKSSPQQLDAVLMEHGLQLQLLAYLNVIRQWPEPRKLFGAAQLIPAGVFYVNLRGKYGSEKNRTAALAELDQVRKLAYQHSGRFDAAALRQLDGRPDAQEGDQFNYRTTNSGEIHKGCREPMPSAEFATLLDSVETNLKKMGQEIFSGLAKVSPYRKGSITACDQCGYQSICRIDPWTHSFRVLKK